MAKKSAPADPRKIALEALVVSLSEMTPKVLYGTKAAPGFFNGTAAAIKQAAEVCLLEDWLEDTGQKSGSGSKAKPLFRLSDKGKQAILDNNPTTVLLEGIRASVEKQKEQVQSLNATFQAMQNGTSSVEKGIREVVEQGIRAFVEKQKEQFHSLNATFQAMQSGVQRVEQVIQEVVKKVKPHRIEELAPKSNGNGYAHGNGNVPRSELEEEIVRRVGHRHRDDAIPLPVLYKELKSRWQNLSIGVFHDSLRDLRGHDRLRFGAYTRALAAISMDQEPMFWEGEVVYYAYSA